MSLPIDPRKVAGVVVDVNAVLANKGLNSGEILIGLSELIGRVIVDAGQTHIQHDDIKKVVQEHIDRTVRIGAHATEKSIIA